MSNSPSCIEKVLSKLNNVRQAGANRWNACCPAHDDKNPSLSIRETDDGKVLIHCWANCSAAEITAAMGLQMRDLFPGMKTLRRGPSKAAIEHELWVIKLSHAHHPLDEVDQARLDLAKLRLGVE